MSLDEKYFNEFIRKENVRITTILCKVYGFEKIDLIEDAVQEAIVAAFQSWKLRGLPENPEGWIYKVAKNKIINLINKEKHRQRILEKNKSIFPSDYLLEAKWETERKSIDDSLLQMLFVVSHPLIPVDYQSAMALKILLGFSVSEIAEVFFSNVETIQKRLYRGKQIIIEKKIPIAFPDQMNFSERIDSVLKILYLLFSKGYYSNQVENLFRKDLMQESLRLTILLSENERCRNANVLALIALICFHCSRLESRLSDEGQILSWLRQNKNLWDQTMVSKGKEYLTNSLNFGNQIYSDYQLEALIALLHTEDESKKKWEDLLILYSKLYDLNQNPSVNLNRIYAMSCVFGNPTARVELEKTNSLGKNLFVDLLWAKLWKEEDEIRAKQFLDSALNLSNSINERKMILANWANL
ncbi:sigma-70 family RNA polymerase sigma factor [Leptospira ognonensis]|uniref:Sigma-70 family RNA polymerase sigma factor n=1 Tax=Leptospira ognonensis TaxID=2484945 RepID=A0A4R9KBU4_9LEPT|nr:sigma-70 family RNA polymerase sigma factor [Leptospira ognonensis]TGL62313.1 sigma-70 family RNA polymerase sigma factor [Leptospira ognonensis]